MPDPTPPRWPLATFAGKAVIVAVVVLAVAAALYYGVSSLRGPTPPGTGDGRPVILRPDFDRMIMGKAEDEVVAAVGRPDATTEDGGTKYWHYKRRVRDPLTNAADTDVQVVLEGGKVVGINY